MLYLLTQFSVHHNRLVNRPVLASLQMLSKSAFQSPQLGNKDTSTYLLERVARSQLKAENPLLFD